MSDFFFTPKGELKTNDQLICTMKSAKFQRTVTEFNRMCDDGEMDTVFDSNQKNIIKVFAEIIASDCLLQLKDDDDTEDCKSSPSEDSEVLSISLAQLFYKAYDKDEIMSSIQQLKRQMKSEYKRLSLQAERIAQEIENDPHFNSAISVDRKKPKSCRGKARK